MSERAAAEKAVAAVEQLSRDVDLPEGLSICGAKEEDLPELSESIAENFMVPLSPRIAKADDILEICNAALYTINYPLKSNSVGTGGDPWPKGIGAVFCEST